MKNNKDTTNGIMIISIYQIIPELDTDHIKYMDLDFMQRHGYENPPANIYKAVYHGEVPVQNLDEVYRHPKICNSRIENDYDIKKEFLPQFDAHVEKMHLFLQSIFSE